MPILADSFKIFGISVKEPLYIFGNRDGFPLFSHKHMPGIPFGADLTSGFVGDFVIEADGGSFDLADPDLYLNPVVIGDLAFVSSMDFDDGEKNTALFELLIGEASVSAPGASGLFEPIEVVRVVGVAHLVGLAVADADSFDGLGLMHFSSFVEEAAVTAGVARQGYGYSKGRWNDLGLWLMRGYPGVCARASLRRPGYYL